MQATGIPRRISWLTPPVADAIRLAPPSSDHDWMAWRVRMAARQPKQLAARAAMMRLRPRQEQLPQARISRGTESRAPGGSQAGGEAAVSTLIERLRQMVSLTAPSGREEEMIRYLTRELEGLADEVTVDPLGSIIALKRGADPGGRRIAVTAHMDEIGFMVRRIEPNGFLRFEKMGGHDHRVMLAQRVWVRGARGRVAGVIGCKSKHLNVYNPADLDRVPNYTEMYIDLGAESAEQVRAMGIRVGDGVGYASELTELGIGTGRYVGKGLDDRVGCALLLELLHGLRGRSLPGDLHAVFTVQEEVGLRGAKAAANAVQADIALALDTTATDDTPETGARHLVLGGGPAIKVMDFSLLAHPAVLRVMEAAAERAGVAVQHELLPGIGTDAGAFHQAGRGAVTGCLSVGNRYTHSPVEMVDLRDLVGASRLLFETVLGLYQADLSISGEGMR